MHFRSPEAENTINKNLLIHCGFIYSSEIIKGTLSPLTPAKGTYSPFGNPVLINSSPNKGFEFIRTERPENINTFSRNIKGNKIPLYMQINKYCHIESIGYKRGKFYEG